VRPVSIQELIVYPLMRESLIGMNAEDPVLPDPVLRSSRRSWRLWRLLGARRRHGGAHRMPTGPAENPLGL
jgi:hypothetical protein